MGANGGGGFVPNFNGGGGGGGITQLLLGRTNYVSSAGTGGQYQHLENHYTDINEAISDLQNDNDLVVVLPGTYTITDEAAFQDITNLFFYPGAEVTISDVGANNLTKLNIGGLGDIIFELLNTDFSNSIESLNIQCNSLNVVDTGIDFNNCNIVINCLENCYFLNSLAFATDSGTFYNVFNVTANRIESNNGILWTNSNYSVNLTATSNIIEGYVSIENTENKIFNFVLNGDLVHELNVNQPGINIVGNAWMNNYNNFNGFQHNGILRCTNNQPAILASNARFNYTGGIKHQIQNQVANPDLPAVQINNEGNSIVNLAPAPGYSIASFNSDGAKGVVYANNDGATHQIQATGKFLNLGVDGNVFEAQAATQQLILGFIWSNLPIDGTNCNIQSQGATNTDTQII